MKEVEMFIIVVPGQYLGKALSYGTFDTRAKASSWAKDHIHNSFDIMPLMKIERK